MKKLNNYKIQKGLNNPVLRQKSVKIETIDKEIIDFAKDLTDLMWEYDGVGLAAPQVGKNIRMISTTFWTVKGKNRNMNKQLIMINPEILEYSQETEIDEEGCLSLPGIKGDVARFKEIKLKYTDITGKEKIVVLNGLNARIIQHELDHLDGVLFADKIIKKDKFGLEKFIRL